MIPDALIHLSFIGNAYDLDAVGPHGVNVVFRLIKWAFVALSVFAIVTASDEQKAAMTTGVQAFGGALFTACTRPGSPCTTAIVVVKTEVGKAWQASRDQPGQQATPDNARYRLRPEDGPDALPYPKQW